jgi:hypothetical protein
VAFKIFETMKDRLRVEKRRLAAKSYWVDKVNPCQNSELIFSESREYLSKGDEKGILEFGANAGGNLLYALDQWPNASVTGVDINKIVETPNAKNINYTGMVGDEHTLKKFSDNEFDLSFTASVLDHIPSDKVSFGALKEMIRVSKRVVLLEPFIAGHHCDVSNQPRHRFVPHFPDDGTKFANYCYLWNYDQFLNEQGVEWTKKATPLHQHSLGPFYYLYTIQPS